MACGMGHWPLDVANILLNLLILIFKNERLLLPHSYPDQSSKTFKIYEYFETVLSFVVKVAYRYS